MSSFKFERIIIVYAKNNEKNKISKIINNDVNYNHDFLIHSQHFIFIL